MRTGGCVIACAMAAAAAAQSVPRFDDFAVREEFHAIPAAPLLRTPDQRMFRTRIREAAAKGPNFAGHYAIAVWGCGAGCVSMALVDERTGAVYNSPFGALSSPLDMEVEESGLHFVPWSSLLIAAGCPNEKDCGTYYYHWIESKFELLRKIVGGPPLEDVRTGDKGGVRVVLSDGRELALGDGSVSSIEIAESKMAAGWLSEQDVFGTNNPVPLSLGVYRPGKPLRAFGDGMVIENWVFLENGTQVAFSSNTAHGDRAPHCELWDVESNKRIAAWNGHPDDDGAPSWAGFLKN